MLNLHSFKALANEGLRNWEYHVVGDGTRRRAMEHFVRANEIVDKVYFYGHLEHSAAMEVINRCDVLVLPSKNEAFGVAYLEAMALRLLVIGIKGQGPSDFIDHMTDGILIEFDARQLSDTLRHILCDQERFRTVAEAGRRKAGSKYTFEQNGKRLLEIYRAILASNDRETRWIR